MLTKNILFGVNMLSLAGFVVMGLTLTLNRMGQTRSFTWFTISTVFRGCSLRRLCWRGFHLTTDATGAGLRGLAGRTMVVAKHCLRTAKRGVRQWDSSVHRKAATHRL